MSPAIAKTSVLFQCDNPKCESRHGKLSSFSWDEDLAKQDVSTLPDDFSLLIKIHPDPFRSDYFVLFCGAVCAKDYLVYTYVPPKTPRQLKKESDAELASHVNEEGKKAIEEQLELPFTAEEVVSGNLN
jgi:hypothetical protein